MGQIVATPLHNVIWGNRKELRILMTGLPEVGKTTLLYMLKEGIKMTTISSVDFQVESIDHRNVKFTVWNVPGRAWAYPHLYPLKEWTSTSKGLIFVVDSTQGEGEFGIAEARDWLQRMMSELQLESVKVVVFANKQDLPQAKSVAEVTEAMALSTMLKPGQCLVQGCCATTGEGLREGLDWLATALRDG